MYGKNKIIYILYSVKKRVLIEKYIKDIEDKYIFVIF